MTANDRDVSHYTSAGAGESLHEGPSMRKRARVAAETKTPGERLTGKRNLACGPGSGHAAQAGLLSGEEALDDVKRRRSKGPQVHDAIESGTVEQYSCRSELLRALRRVAPDHTGSSSSGEHDRKRKRGNETPAAQSGGAAATDNDGDTFFSSRKALLQALRHNSFRDKGNAVGDEPEDAK